jgi:hypothetical protein
VFYISGCILFFEHHFGVAHASLCMIRPIALSLIQVRKCKRLLQRHNLLVGTNSC